MTIKEYIGSVITDFREEYKNDSQVIGAYDRGVAKDEKSIEILLRMIKARKGTTKMVNLCAKHRLHVTQEFDNVYCLDFQTASGDGLNNKIVEVNLNAKNKPKGSVEVLKQLEKINYTIIASFVSHIIAAFANDSIMQKAIKTGKEKLETNYDLTIRIIKCRKNSSRTVKIAENHGMTIRFDNNDFIISYDRSSLENIVKNKTDIDPKCLKEIQTYLDMVEEEVVEEKDTKTNFTIEEKVVEEQAAERIDVEITEEMRVVCALQDIEKAFEHDSIVQKYIFDAKKSDAQTDNSLLFKISKFRNTSKKLRDILFKYDLVLGASGVEIKDGSSIKESLVFVGRAAKTVETGTSQTKSMAELNKEKQNASTTNTFKETKSVDELKKEVFGNVVAEMMDRDALTHISTQLTEVFKNDTVVKKSFLVAEKNQEGLAGKIFRAQKIRPSSAGLKALLETILCDIDALDDYKTLDISQVRTENENDKKFDDLKNSKFKYQISVGSITIFDPSGETFNASSSHPEYDNIKRALKNEEFKEALVLINKIAQVKESLAKLNAVEVEIEGRKVSIDIINRVLIIKYADTGEEKNLNGALASFIVSLAAGSDGTFKVSEEHTKKYNSISKFIMKMAANNMDETSMDGLFKFLKNARIPINEEGNILTYKRIDINYKDCYTHTLDNSIGATVSMERSKVTCNPKITCSSGLHVCSYSYLSSFSGDRIVICEVEPHNVVSVPVDYNFAKMRCCKYKVIEEVANNTGNVLATRENSVYMV